MNAQRLPLSPVLSLQRITKRFERVLANDAVDLDLNRGEVHALLGENGAGKSTLMNIASGLYLPDEGRILVHGSEVHFDSPDDAARSGVGMVHQHFHLIDRFTVAENVHLGWSETPKRLNRRTLEQRTRELAEGFRIPIDPAARVVHLSVGEQQRVEILRTLIRAPEVLILDEPTAVLSPQQVEGLLEIVRVAREGGTTVVLISHKLDEVLAIADRVTVMRAGQRISTRPRSECDRASLVSDMMGGDTETHVTPEAIKRGSPVLAASGVSAIGDRGNVALTDVDLVVHAHEIVGVAGVSGNGQRELSEILTGLRRPTSGRVLVGDRDLSRGSTRDFIDVGVGHIPEDRRSTGLALGQPIWANAILKAYREASLRNGPLLRRANARRFATDLAEAARVSLPSLDAPVEHLSGGNTQRLLAARENWCATHALVAVHPTRGLDVGATEAVRAALLTARRSGLGILLISEDLDEVIALSDRIVVLSGGRITGAFDHGDADREEIGLLMGGVSRVSG